MGRRWGGKAKSLRKGQNRIRTGNTDHGRRRSSARVWVKPRGGPPARCGGVVREGSKGRDAGWGFAARQECGSQGKGVGEAGGASREGAPGGGLGTFSS